MVTPRNRLSAYATFRSTFVQVNARVAVSIDQARQNLEKEIPDGQSLEETAKSTRVAWVEKRDRIKLVGATKDILYGVLPYPSNTLTNKMSMERTRIGQNGAWLIPERMVQGMIQDYREVYRPGIDILTTFFVARWLASDVEKHHWYSDREEFVDYEVRAGLSSVHEQKGWVADDIHFESASRTLDCSSESVAQVKPTLRSPCFSENTLFTIFNPATGFMEARNASGAWAGSDNGWTKGGKWTCPLDVVHDIPGLIERKGGNASIVLQGIMIIRMRFCAASKPQTRIRQITESDYNAIVNGGLNVQNEDCGQMSAWYLFSASNSTRPFFDKVSIDLPSSSKKLEIISPGAPSKPYAP
ncbi:hypothetical protein L210DRAFT_3504159 [Boletus edulis BED1]|uniref:Glycosyl hydrolase family 92 domain-containing protein n=1 Tax=Boletus edulis BED1 TaxID=1328754 RepID=A0AAD4BTZ1_BOLED|nr:hypothetical protein L210DRAFT_3504159 [Boletus edulis BED1]